MDSRERQNRLETVESYRPRMIRIEHFIGRQACIGVEERQVLAVDCEREDRDRRTGRLLKLRVIEVVRMKKAAS